MVEPACFRFGPRDRACAGGYLDRSLSPHPPNT